MRQITILGNTKYTKWLRWLPCCNVYYNSKWSLTQNLMWLETAWMRGDMIIILRGGHIFAKELALLALLAEKDNR